LCLLHRFACFGFGLRHAALSAIVASLSNVVGAMPAHLHKEVEAATAALAKARGELKE